MSTENFVEWADCTTEGAIGCFHRCQTVEYEKKEAYRLYFHGEHLPERPTKEGSVTKAALEPILDFIKGDVHD